MTRSSARPRLKPRPGHAERAVLVVELGVGLAVARLGDAPRHAALAAVFDLPLDHGAVGLVEQRAVVGRHHQQRHQVLEHRPAPGEQRRPPAGRGQQPAEAEPVLLRELALGDGDEAGQARLGGQQVVEAGVEPVVADVVADRQQVAVAVVEELVVDVGQLGAAGGELPQLGEPLRRPLGRLHQRRRAVGRASRGSGRQRRSAGPASPARRRPPAATSVPAARRRPVSGPGRAAEQVAQFAEPSHDCRHPGRHIASAGVGRSTQGARCFSSSSA